MSSTADIADNDSLHVLPLSMIPLQVNALKKTRLIKNTRLEGVVELYSESSIGSGQVMPDALGKVFDFSGDRKKDLEIVTNLAALNSYDVYSLRLSLRKLGIAVDNFESLQLSPAMADSLLEHMSVFTRPLVLKVYGDATVEGGGSFGDVLKLFTDPNADAARQNLRTLANSLDIKLMQIPVFLENYADVFLSLSFYQKCHDDTEADLAEFLDDLRVLAHNPRLSSQTAAVKEIERVANKISDLHSGVANVIDRFRVRTEDMWQNISAEQYRKMSNLISDHQERIGANLCAITVKLSAWKEQATASSGEGAAEKFGFVVREISHGLENLEGIKFQDV